MIVFFSYECQLQKKSEYDKNLFNFYFLALGRLLQYFFGLLSGEITPK
jgi:hypothetical protein